MGTGPATGERVLLLHGIGRTAASMAKLERVLRAAGYATLNLDYPSRRMPLEALAADVSRRGAAFIDRPGGRLHIVAHSMGGLLARVLVTRHRPPALGRVVMFGVPNAGSEIADLLSRTALYRRVYGPAGLQLVTETGDALRAALGPIDYPLGVIAGDRALDPLGYALLPGANDGRVAVARTRVEGMTDHIVLHVTHALMMRNAEVMRQTLHFLRHGRFDRPTAEQGGTS